MEEDLRFWINQLETSILDPILPWLCGWPKVVNGAESETVSSILEAAKVLNCWIQLHRDSILPFDTDTVRLRLITLAFSAASQPDLTTSSTSKGHSFRQHIACLGAILDDRNTAVPVSLNASEESKEFNGAGAALWESFFDGPVLQVRQLFKARITSPANNALLEYHLGKAQGNTRKRATSRNRTLQQIGIANDVGANDKKHAARALEHPIMAASFPLIIFPDSNDLLTYQIPWDSLPLLSEQNITVGIDLALFSWILNQWKSNYKPLGSSLVPSCLYFVFHSLLIEIDISLLL